MSGLGNRKSLNILAHEYGYIAEFFGIGNKVVFLNGGQKHSFGNAVSHIVLTAELMSHSVNISEVAVVESKTGKV